MAVIIFFCIGILTLPTNLAQIIPFLKRKYPPPNSLYFSSLCTNIGIAFIISAMECSEKMNARFIEFSLYIVFALLFYGFGVIASFFKLTYCFSEVNAIDELDDEIDANFDNYKNFTRKLAENRTSAPVISVHCESYHIRKTIIHEIDEDGVDRTREIEERITTYSNDHNIEYGSWQEEGNPINLPKNVSLIHCKVIPYYYYDLELQQIINRMEEQAYNEALSHDEKVVVYCNPTVSGFYANINGTTKLNQQTPRVKWIATKNGKYLIMFLKFFGYSTLIYSPWTSKGINYSTKVIKNISIKPKNLSGFRCGYLENDYYAGQKTFRGKNAKNIKINDDSIDLSKISETALNIVESFKKATNNE